MIGDIDRHVAARVKKRRQECGLTQTQLGAALSVTYQQVQKYERGVNRIGAGRLFAVAQALGVNPAWFFDGLEPAGPPVDETAARIRALDGRGRLAIFEFLNALEKRGPPEEAHG